MTKQELQIMSDEQVRNELVEELVQMLPISSHQDYDAWKDKVSGAVDLFTELIARKVASIN